jgi:hypothetical protein
VPVLLAVPRLDAGRAQGVQRAPGVRRAPVLEVAPGARLVRVLKMVQDGPQAQAQDVVQVLQEARAARKVRVLQEAQDGPQALAALALRVAAALLLSQVPISLERAGAFPGTAVSAERAGAGVVFVEPALAVPRAPREVQPGVDSRLVHSVQGPVQAGRFAQRASVVQRVSIVQRPRDGKREYGSSLQEAGLARSMPDAPGLPTRTVPDSKLPSVHAPPVPQPAASAPPGAPLFQQGWGVR